MKFIRLHIVLLVLLNFLNLNAQVPFIRNEGLKGNLPSKTIYDLYHHSSGYLYLGTEIGLIKYNGIEYTLFPFEFCQGNSINAIHEDALGQIWCMNFSNQLFQLKDDILVPHSQINNEIRKYGQFRSFTIVGSEIWIITDEHILVWNDSKIKQIENPLKSKNLKYYTSILFDSKNGRVLISDVNFLYQFKKGKFEKKYTITDGFNEFTLKNGDIYHSIKQDVKGLKKLNESTFLLHSTPLPTTYLNKIIPDKNFLWLCTNSGLLAFNCLTNKIEYQLLSNIRISDLVIDHEGGKWISSVEKGLFYMPDQNIQFLSFSDYAHTSLTKGPNKTFFVGTGKGEIIQFDNNGKEIQKFIGLSETQIEYIEYDAVKNIIISSHGVFNLDRTKKDFLTYLGKSISKDNRGNYLMAFYNAAFLVNQNFRDPPTISDNQQKSVLESPFFKYIPLRNNRSKAGIFSFAENAYFVGYSDKLIRHGINGGEKIIQDIHQNDIIALDFVERKSGQIIVASLQSGIHFITNNKATHLIDTKSGLNSNICLKIKEKDGILYVLTNKGINWINLKTLKVGSFVLVHQLTGYSFSDFIVDSDRILITSDAGIFSVPNNIKDNGVSPLMKNIVLKVNNTLISEGKNEFYYHENNFLFSIETIHFRGNGDYKLRYRLKGYSDYWFEQFPKNNEMNFVSLPPGKYTFEVQTVLNGKHSQSYTYSFTIKKAFWDTWWFQLVVVVSILALINFFVKRYIRALRNKQLDKINVLKSQLVAIRSQMNPHFLFNILNSVQGLIYENKRTEASVFLGKFSQLMRRILELSDQTNIPIFKELELLQLYLELESIRFEEDNNFVFNIEHSIAGADLDLMIPSMIVQPFVENSVKHGLLHKQGDKCLTILFEITEEKSLRIQIIDNGIGRMASEQINKKRVRHSSFATKAINSRIELLNKLRKMPIEIEIIDLIEKNEGTGTQVIINIPFEDE